MTVESSKINAYTFVQSEGLNASKINAYVWVVPTPTVPEPTPFGMLENLIDDSLDIGASLSSADLATSNTMGLAIELLEGVNDNDLNIASLISTDPCGTPQSLFFASQLYPSGLMEEL